MRSTLYGLLVCAVLVSPALAADDGDDASGAASAGKSIRDADDSSKDIKDAVDNIHDAISDMKGGGDSSSAGGDDSGGVTGSSGATSGGGSSGGWSGSSAVTSGEAAGNSGGATPGGSAGGAAQAGNTAAPMHEGMPTGNNSSGATADVAKMREGIAAKGGEAQDASGSVPSATSHAGHSHTRLASTSGASGGHSSSSGGFFNRLGSSMKQGFHSAGQKLQSMRTGNSNQAHGFKNTPPWAQKQGLQQNMASKMKSNNTMLESKK